MSLRIRLLGAAALLAACVPSIEKPKNTGTGNTVVALFEPVADDPCASVLPFPSDLAKDPTTGRLNVPICKSDDPTSAALKAGLGTLDGYSINGPIYEKFSGALDAASLKTPLAVTLVNAGTQVPVAVNPVFDPSSNTLYLDLKGAHLAERSTYVVVITDLVKGTDGKPIISDQAFTLMKSKTPLVDAHGHSTSGALSNDQANGLEQLRQGFAPLFEQFEASGLGLTRDNIAVAWTFTTQTVHASYPQLAGLVSATGAKVTVDTAIPASSHPLLVAQGLDQGLGCVYTGRIELTNLLTSTRTFGVDASGHPVTSRIEVPYVLATPTGVACGAWGPGNVAIYVHGLGRCKNDAFALAGALAQAGWATLSLDGPYAGGRVSENLGDQNLDGCPDQPATPELIGASPNPFAIRDALREWGLELVQVAAAVKTDAAQFAGVTTAAPATVGMVGHSWGGIAAVLARSVSTSVTALATNATPGELGGAFAPVLTQALGQAAAQQAIPTFRWILEPADPLYAAEAITPAQTGALAQVVAAGSGTVHDAPLHPTTSQQALAVKLEPTADVPKTTFVMSDATNGSYCDDSSSMVGELLKPCKASALSPTLIPTDPSVVFYAMMRRQVVTFLATGGAFICTPDPTTGGCG